MRLLAISFLFFSLGAFSQKNEVFQIDSLPKEGILLDKGWKWQAGDNPDFAKTDFDDSAWEGIDPTRQIHYLPQIRKETIGWFRIRLRADTSLLNKPLAFQIYQSIASEIYQNGILLKQYGKVSNSRAEIKAIQPLHDIAGLQFNNTDQVIAVRFSVQPKVYYSNFVAPFSTFQLRINDVWGAGQFNRIARRFPVLSGIYMGIFIILTIIHLGFFLINKKHKANLFFSLATLSGAIAHGLSIMVTLSHDVGFRSVAGSIVYFFLFTLYNLFLLAAIYRLFSRPPNARFWGLIIYSIASLTLWFMVYERSHLWAFYFPFLFSMIECLRVAFIAYRQKFIDAIIILVGLVFYLVFATAFQLGYEGLISNRTIGFGLGLIDVFFQISVACIPIALSIYFFRDFAFTSKNLGKKLIEIQHLSSEKQQILASQNETLEKQVESRTAELKASQTQLIQAEKLASLGELTAGIAHEIQNPLNFVNNFAELSVDLAKELKEEAQKPEIDKELILDLATDLSQNQEKIHHHGIRASNIVKGMLEHSRKNSGEKEPTDINDLADEYLRLAYHGLRAKDKSFNADFKTDFDPNLPKIDVIPQDMGRVLLNLINNAFYACSQRSQREVASTTLSHRTSLPKVVVSTRLHRSLSGAEASDANARAEIRISDNGPGIPPEIKAKIFQPFFTTKPTGEGTGLGLSLAYDIVTKGHGGTLEVHSTEGVGSEFIITLPIKTV